MAIALLLLLGSGKHQPPNPIWVDAIEVNHVVRGEKVCLHQVIYWRWKWDGKLQDDEYLELRINDRWYETVTRPYAGQIQVKLDKLEAGNHTWSIVLMSRASMWPVQQSEKRPFTID